MEKYMKICNPECPFLFPKEEEQKKGDIHMCSIYNKRIYHGPYHPEIIAVEGCKFSIKGDEKCHKGIQNVNCLETALTSPRQISVPRGVISMSLKTLMKWWKYLIK